MDIFSNIRSLCKQALGGFRSPSASLVWDAEPQLMNPGILEWLSADRPLRTREIHAQNDFYGHATILKRYAGLPPDQALKVVIEHGLFLGGFVWDADISSCLPTILVPGKFRYPVLEKCTSKRLHAVGPMIGYAPHLLNAEGIRREKLRLGRNLLAFPAHSTHHVVAHFDIEAYCSRLRELGRRFDSVRLCLYWKDILRGWGREFSARGFECVTAGHIFDPLFLPRLKSIVECATVTTSNELGTQLGYCVFLGKPHYLTSSQIVRTATTGATVKRDAPDRSAKPDGIEIKEAFADFQETVRPVQHEIVDRYWGISELKSPAELRRVIEEAEKDYRTQRTMAQRLRDKYRWIIRP